MTPRFFEGLVRARAREARGFQAKRDRLPGAAVPAAGDLPGPRGSGAGAEGGASKGLPVASGRKLATGSSRWEAR